MQVPWAGEEVHAVAVALYRKYRPRTFAEMIGQEHVTEPLSQALRTGRLHHAYLFSGPRGCGKTTSARILARSMNCVSGPTPEPCGECESCRAQAGDGPGSVDVIEIDAASHGGVDDARDLRERAFFTPVAGRYKIYVIDEAHMVSSAGFNALLKLVEEPPEYVKFVFATTEPEKVLPTIKSRTHHYPFRLVPPGVLRPYLEQLCAAEGVTVEPAVFPLVVRAGGGSVRDSLSVLDQLLAGADPQQGVGYERAVALLGVTDTALLDEVVDALAAGDGAAMFATVDRVIEAGHDPRRFAADLLERLRDLIVLRQVPDAADKGLLDAPEDALSRMATQASQLGPATLTRCAEVVHNGMVEMRGTTSPRLLLELICARMLLPGAEESGGALWQRLERLERRLGAAEAPGAGPAAALPPPTPRSGTPDHVPAPDPALASDPALAPEALAPDHAPAPGPAPAKASATGPVSPDPAAAPTPDRGQPAASAPSPPPAAPGLPDAAPAATGGPATLDAAAIRRVWDEVVTTVSRHSKRAAAVAREAAVRDVDGDTVVLLFQHQVHATMLAAAPQPVLDALHEVLGGTWRIRCESRGGGPPEPPAATVPAAGATTPPPDPVAAPEEDWPEPARPGGNTGASSPASAGGSRKPQEGSGPRGGSPMPDDEVLGDGTAAARSGEEQALDLLQRTLGAEKIGEVAP